VIGGATAGLLALPDLVVAVVLVWIAARTRLLPAGGATTADVSGASGRVADLARHLVLPATALTLVVVPPLVRHVRAAILGVLKAPYIRAAVARGVPRRRVLYRSALRAAAHPLVVLFGLSLAGVFSASLAIEVVTSWPGLGPLLLEAVIARDQYVVLAGVTLAATLLLAGNLMADALLVVVDPRVRR
jgi:peptide/nickel transport system permease protein